MGNKACPICKSETPWLGECDYCEGFIEQVNKSHVEKIWARQNFSPVHMFEKENCFNSSIQESTCKGRFAILARNQDSKDSKDLSCWFHKTPGVCFNRHDFATYAQWNSAKAQIVLFVPCHITWFEGSTGPQPPAYLGGGTQIFIPFEVASLLFPASEKFRNNITKEGYLQFLKDCQPALEAQRQWKAKFRKMLKIKEQEAKEFAVIRDLRTKFEQEQKFKQDAPDNYKAFGLREITQKLPNIHIVHEENKKHFEALCSEIKIFETTHKTDVDKRMKRIQDTKRLAHLQSLVESLEVITNNIEKSVDNDSIYIALSDYIAEAQNLNVLEKPKLQEEFTERFRECIQKAKKLASEAREKFFQWKKQDIFDFVIKYVQIFPAKGNKFNNLPCHLQEFIQSGKPTMSISSNTHDLPPSQQTLTLHVFSNHSPSCSKNVSLEMRITFNHSETKQNGQQTITIHYYDVTYDVVTS